MNLNILIPSAYLLVALVAARIAYKQIRIANEDSGYPDEDIDDRVTSGVMAFIIGLVWPVAILVAIVMWKPAKTPAEVEAERDAMASRIRELEAELGIRGDR